MRYVWLAVCLLIIAACTPVAQEPASLYDRVANVEGELLYHDVFLDRTPSDEIVFFGVRLGDSEENVTSLHGEADVVSEFQFGSIRNLEYGFGKENTTAILYHIERGIVKSVLVTTDANEWLVNETALMGGRERVYGLLGIPTVAQDLPLERAFYYSDLGYTVYLNRDGMDRVYFSTPSPTPSSTVCAQVITPAVNAEGLCVEFQTPCDIPSGWEPVESCEGRESFDNQTIAPVDDTESEEVAEETPQEEVPEPVEEESTTVSDNQAPVITI